MRTLLLAFSLVACAATAAPVVTVYGSLAPNRYGSSYWDAWTLNAIDALTHGQTQAGDVETPARFETVTAVTGRQILVTSFPSWMGFAAPESVFGAAFAEEHGNRITFPVHITSVDSKFSISQLSLQVESTDPAHAFTASVSAGGYGYGAGWIGLNYGTDGRKGTTDDFWVTGGVNTQLINELFGRGSGFGLWPCEGRVCSTTPEQQAAIELEASYPGNWENYTITATYRLLDGSTMLAAGARSVEVNPTPEPSTLALIGGSLIVVGLRRRILTSSRESPTRRTCD